MKTSKVKSVLGLLLFQVKSFIFIENYSNYSFVITFIEVATVRALKLLKAYLLQGQTLVVPSLPSSLPPLSCIIVLLGLPATLKVNSLAENKEGLVYGPMLTFSLTHAMPSSLIEFDDMLRRRKINSRLNCWHESSASNGR